MRALLTNDDGIDSRFLHHLAAAVAEFFEVTIVAPKVEQSWIGRALSRHRSIDVEERTDLPWKAWSVDGTPSDCINIAFGHLIEMKPDIVISGINIGYNTTLPLIYSSGTVAGAIEGAHWGIPAIAASQAIPEGVFDQVSKERGLVPAKMEATLRASAAHVAQFAVGLLEAGRANPDCVVHNLNFPHNVTATTKFTKTVPGRLGPICLYASEDGKKYSFRYAAPETFPGCDKPTDRDTVHNGEISHSRLDFHQLGQGL